MGEEVIHENPPSKKRTGWQAPFVAFMRENRRRPFEPGKWDCAVWAAGAVEIMTGEDHLRGFRGYRTIAEGKRFLQAKGFEDHVAYVASVLPEIWPSRAQVGDLAVIDGQSLGIVQGAQVYMFGVNGFGMAPFDIIGRAFRV